MRIQLMSGDMVCLGKKQTHELMEQDRYDIAELIKGNGRESKHQSFGHELFFSEKNFFYPFIPYRQILFPFFYRPSSQ